MKISDAILRAFAERRLPASELLALDRRLLEEEALRERLAALGGKPLDAPERAATEAEAGSAARVRAAEDAVGRLPGRYFAYLAGLALVGLTAWMILSRLGPAMPAELRKACEQVAREETITPLLDFVLRPSTAPRQPKEGFGLISPVRTVWRSPEVEFRWRPLAEATGYKVVLVREGDSAVIESPVLPREQHSWRSLALREDSWHSVEIQAWRDGAMVQATPKGQVQVLNALELAALEEVERIHARDPFVLGVARARLGLRSDARLAFETLRGDARRAGLAAKLLKELE